MKRPFSKLLRQ